LSGKFIFVHYNPYFQEAHIKFYQNSGFTALSNAASPLLISTQQLHVSAIDVKSSDKMNMF